MKVGILREKIDETKMKWEEIREMEREAIKVYMFDNILKVVYIMMDN
jgi:hypothetical protein